MTTYATGLQALRSVSGPSSSSRSEYARRYDYSGLDEHIKRQDAVAGLRGSKFKAGMQGDIEGISEAGGRIRDLVAALKMNSPEASEQNPVTMANPLVKLESESGGQSSSSDAGGYQLAPPPAADDMADVDPDAPAVAVRRRNGVGGDPQRFANVA
jgi:hypothetical protein